MCITGLGGGYRGSTLSSPSKSLWETLQLANPYIFEQKGTGPASSPAVNAGAHLDSFRIYSKSRRDHADMLVNLPVFRGKQVLSQSYLIGGKSSSGFPDTVTPAQAVAVQKICRLTLGGCRNNEQEVVAVQNNNAASKRKVAWIPTAKLIPAP